MAGRRKRRVERTYVTDSLLEAFEAALRLYDVWDSPDGEAVVRDVDDIGLGRFRITYRVIAVWGKEAW